MSSVEGSLYPQFEVTFAEKLMHKTEPVYTLEKWTATYRAKDFCDAELCAKSTLARNNDKRSFIFKIELYL